MSRVWITSDLHFCHNREFLYGPRGFQTVDEMNDKIIANMKEVVAEDDDLYILGDLMLNDNEKGIALVKQLPGLLHIVVGNHDTEERIKMYLNCFNVVEINYAIRLKYKKHSLYLTHYPTLCGNLDTANVINLCGHSHTKDKFADFDKSLIYHCELDAHNNYPVLLDDAINDIYSKIQLSQ